MEKTSCLSQGSSGGKSTCTSSLRTEGEDQTGPPSCPEWAEGQGCRGAGSLHVALSDQGKGRRRCERPRNKDSGSSTGPTGCQAPGISQRLPAGLPAKQRGEHPAQACSSPASLSVIKELHS